MKLIELLVDGEGLIGSMLDISDECMVKRHLDDGCRDYLWVSWMNEAKKESSEAYVTWIAKHSDWMFADVRSVYFDNDGKVDQINLSHLE